jgi:hypothetical protein
MAESLSAMPGVAVDSGFDYGEVNDQWVTNPDISKALAQRIDCLAHRSTVNGGPGKVVIVAHSMGGLATRCASSTSCSGGPDITGKLGEVITLGTPNEGSFLRGNSVQSGAEQVLLKSLRLNCWALSFLQVCDMRRVWEGPGSTAFTPGSPELNNLPQLPASVPVAALAGQVAVTTQLFGRTVTLAGNAGDLVVSVPSAHAAAHEYGGVGGASTIDCGTAAVPITVGWKAPACWHGTETSNPLWRSKVRGEVQKFLDASAAPGGGAATPPGMHRASLEETSAARTAIGYVGSSGEWEFLISNSDTTYGYLFLKNANGGMFIVRKVAGEWSKLDYPAVGDPADNGLCTERGMQGLGFPISVQRDFIQGGQCFAT